MTEIMHNKRIHGKTRRRSMHLRRVIYVIGKIPRKEENSQRR